MGRTQLAASTSDSAPSLQLDRLFPWREISNNLVFQAHRSSRGRSRTLNGRRWEELHHLGHSHWKALEVISNPRSAGTHGGRERSASEEEDTVASLQMVCRREICGAHARRSIDISV